MDLFQKQEDLKCDRLAFLKKLTYLETHRLKMLEFYNGIMEDGKIEWLFVFVFKIKQKMSVVTKN